MTRRKQPWGQQRGWIVPADGSPPQELPQQMVGHRLISWPGTMPEREPAKYYHRHVLNPEGVRSEEHTSELQSQSNLVCRLLLEKKKKKKLKRKYIVKTVEKSTTRTD